MPLTSLDGSSNGNVKMSKTEPDLMGIIVTNRLHHPILFFLVPLDHLPAFLNTSSPFIEHISFCVHQYRLSKNVQNLPDLLLQRSIIVSLPFQHFYLHRLTGDI